MAIRAYNQYCGLARAAEILGERWALLIARDLLVGPKRFTDLQRGLTGIPSNVLTTRLKDLEEAGVIRRRVLPRPAAAIVYELTEYGAELEDALVAIGRWGAKSLGEPGPDEIVTEDSMIVALRTIFRPEAAAGVRASFELRMGGIVFHARVANKRVRVAAGPLEGADLVIEAGPGIRGLLAGEITPQQARKSGIVRLNGKAKPEMLELFARLFRIDPKPAG
ncbi:MAG TPA: helix-turn-helix domain-containing protein [Candidatus Cybelea sp.]